MDEFVVSTVPADGPAPNLQTQCWLSLSPGYIQDQHLKSATAKIHSPATKHTSDQ